MQDFSTRDATPQDPLFYERLEAFMHKSLADIKAFADRESRPFEETRQYVAEWHSRYLFNPPLANAAQNTPPGVTTPFTATKGPRLNQLRSVLYNASRLLESLNEVTGIESFVLAVDPANPDDEGFLGGTLAGREFWRGLRGGGSTGAVSFKLYCSKRIEAQQKQALPSPQSGGTGEPPNTSAPAVKSGPARSLKTDLYEAARSALRTASGVRTAEMKWTNHERLDVYGVRLVGWPADVPILNPSSLKVNQNKKVLECLKNGTLRFEKLFTSTSESPNVVEPTQLSEVEEDFSWAYDPNAGDAADDSAFFMHPGSTETTSSQGNPRPPSSSDSVDFDTWIHSSPNRSRSNSMDPPSRKRQRQVSNDYDNT